MGKCKKCGAEGSKFNPSLCISYDIIYGPNDVLINTDTGLCGNCTNTKLR